MAGIRLSRVKWLAREGSEMAGVFYIVWILGFAVAAIGYYCLYRDKGATPLRIVAALTWPIAIPIDFVFCDRRWPQRLLSTYREWSSVKIAPQKLWDKPPKLGSWR